ncbi:hypothetical protein L1987_86116 [Smallanthus sonchifolius]|uniref:Uncharacterized protein n=1 Tax=Smallanthus sonchifolius TaxID=185202 RepID=A0ACB8XZG7_9ASTR|nr:hypothetical protein L1987_86116 [Smallanthus sonchifolius]
MGHIPPFLLISRAQIPPICSIDLQQVSADEITQSPIISPIHQITSIMATPDVFLQGKHDHFSSSSAFDHTKGDAKSRGFELEKKIEYLESLNDRVSNRRARRWINDRILLELVPRLTGDEIRGLFAPPPWGDEAQPSPFCMTNVGEWDKFRNIDMDKEAGAIEALKGSSSKKKSRVDADKIAALTAWHRVDCRTREAFRQSFLPELVNGFEENIRAFVSEATNEEVLVLYAQDPFHRLLLHGVCEFYDLVSTTESETKGTKVLKMTKIKKKKAGNNELPTITLCAFLKMAKGGFW